MSKPALIVGRDEVSAFLTFPCGAVSRFDAEDEHLAVRFRWSLNSHRGGPYLYCRRSGVSYRLHRLIAGAAAGQFVDHINRDTLDNRRLNLRVCDSRESNRNRCGAKKSSSQYKGVHLHKGTGRWYASIKIDGRSLYLGRYFDEADAARAYDAKALELFGEFAHLNFAGAQQ